MSYQKPEFVEIKMDAEIGSYQSDFDGGDMPRFAEREDTAEANE